MSRRQQGKLELDGLVEDINDDLLKMPVRPMMG
jgi:hypothetical protein